MFSNTAKWLCYAMLAICYLSHTAIAGSVVSGSPNTSASVTLGNLNFTYDGTVKAATCNTVPVGLATSITYSDIGSGVGLINTGSYGVSCTVTEAGYSGTASGTLVIAPAVLTVGTGVNGTYNGTVTVSESALLAYPRIAAGFLPNSGTVVAGTTSIATSGSTMTIQSSPGTIVNWADFSIGAGATVNIDQQSAASSVLLRVTGTTPLQLIGSLNSNGRVFIVDAAGILFDTTAAVNVGGMVTSTLNLPDAIFLSNQWQFNSGVGSNAIVNLGTITTASGGSVYLIAPDINNQGVINAAQGSILLAAGTAVDLTTPANPLVSDATGAPVSTATISGQLLAQNGTIGVYGGALNLSGSVDAGNGSIVLIGANTIIASTFTSGSTLTTGPVGVVTNIGVVNPTGVNLVAGSGAIFTSGTAMTINQSTQNAVINWNAFNASNYSIGGNLAMNFALPNISAITINLVPTTNPGLILGQLTANGMVYAINPSGVIFGTSSILDTSALATSATSPINVVSLGISTNMQVNTGWNILGNSTDASLNIATAMGNANMVNTVWKWNPVTNKWAFYTPSQADGGAAYAATKGYEFLSSINSGEGFWVNAKMPFAFALPIGNLLPAATAQTPPSPGWSMVSVGNNITPSMFNTALSSSSPATGITPVNLTSLWAWDNSQSNWYFYAPSLEAQGGTALTDYSTSKGYLNFIAANKQLGPGMGFWVNKP